MLNTMSLAAMAFALTGQTGPNFPDALDTLRGADTTPQMALVLDSSGSMAGILPGQNPLSPICTYYSATRLPRPRWSSGVAPVITTGGCASCAACPGDPACHLTKMDMLQAALTGCESPTDGILFNWANRVMFSIRAFGTGGADGLITNGGFDTAMGNALALMTSVNTLIPTGSTPLGLQYAAAGVYQSDFFAYNSNPATAACAPTTPAGPAPACNNTLQCRQNYIVVMSDGESNGGNSTYNFVPTNGSITVSDGYGGAGPYADYAARYMFRELANAVPTPVDAMPNVDGVQPFRTYTVAFAAPASAQMMLQNMAIEGDGTPYNATNYQTLATAFQNIILSIVARSNVAFSPGTVQNDGFFSGNYIYTTSFRPFDKGFWLGTTKKYCVDPIKPKPAGFGPDDCLFERIPVATGPLYMNDDPRDVWTNDNSILATQGGAGERINIAMGTNPAIPTAIPGAPYAGRKIVTWDPGTGNWLNVDGTTGPFNPGFTRTNGECGHRRLVNKLYGYTDAVIGPGCSGPSGNPAEVDVWAVGDTVNGSTTLLRYTDDCETPGAQCYLAVNANDGMMHFYNARTGDEVVAVIPGYAWSTNQIFNNQLNQIMDQPNLDSLRRFYFDGESRLYHGDTNGNGIIDGTETAHLIAGLGRGGKAYYKFNVSRGLGFESTGDPSLIPNYRPQAIMVDNTTGFQHLRDTWAAPWIGRFNDMRASPASPTVVAMFPSGHTRMDDVNPAFGPLPAVLPGPPPDSNSSFQTYACGSGVVTDPIYLAPEVCSLQTAANLVCATIPAPLSFCDLTTCTPGTVSIPLFPGDPVPCYDWPGWASLPGSPLPNVSTGPGYILPFGPYQFNTGPTNGIAYQIVFSNISLQPGDTLTVKDGLGNDVVTYTGNAGGVTTPWIYSDSFRFEVVTDGVDDAASIGWQIATINYQRSAPPAPVGPGGQRPTIYVVDINNWNSSPDTTQFAAQPTNNQQAGGVIAAITSDCSALGYPLDTCVDQTTQPDLALMTCPISAEISVFSEGGIFRTGYVGDECGQIWAFDQNPTSAGAAVNAWTVRRLAHLNNINIATRRVLTGHTRDFRKIFTKLDLVVSTCPGARRIGVYFGTGNVQRAALDENMRNSALSQPASLNPGPPLANAWTVLPGTDALGGRPDRDVLGVIWDDGNMRDRNLTGLYNATEVQTVDYAAPGASDGYYIRLTFDEKVLANPLVLDGIAYFSTYSPTTRASECVSASGVATTYAFDNCSAAAVYDDNGNNQPDPWERSLPDVEASDGGSEFLLYAPPDGPPQVFTGNIPPAGAPPRGALPRRPNARSMRLYLWRLNVDPLF